MTKSRYTLNDVAFTYIRLYGSDKRDEIFSTIAEAKRIAAETNETDVIGLAESMLSNVLD